MKKRLALAIAFATAISIGNMIPAFATKLAAPPADSASFSCTRAGGTLSIVTDSDLAFTLGTGDANLQVSDTLTFDAANECGAATALNAGTASALTSVILVGSNDGVGTDVDIKFWLENGNGSYDGRAISWGSLTFSVRIDGDLTFDASGIKTPSRIVAQVDEESFTVGSLKGAYYATGLSFAGGTGNDAFDASGVETTDVTAVGDEGNDTLKGGDGDDSLTGDEGDDALYGGDGDDILTDNTAASDEEGDDALFGGAGNDNLDVDDSCVVTNDYGFDQAWGGAGDDDISADDCDTVAPGDGDDVLTASDGVAALVFADKSAGVTIDLDEEPGVVLSDAGDFYFDDGAGAYVGSGFADTFIGSVGADEFSGGEGADTISGLGGNDTLAGGGGTDVIKGGAGDDTITGDSGADKINAGAGDDRVNAGGGDDIVYGSTGDDYIIGGKGADQAWGGKGQADVCGAEVTDKCEFKK